MLGGSRQVWLIDRMCFDLQHCPFRSMLLKTYPGSRTALDVCSGTSSLGRLPWDVMSQFQG
jgi:hypothetical protein